MNPVTAHAFIDELTKIAGRRIDKQIISGNIGLDDLPGVTATELGVFRAMKGKGAYDVNDKIHKATREMTGAEDPIAAKTEVAGSMDKIKRYLAASSEPEKPQAGASRLPPPTFASELSSGLRL